ncbi:MAG: energy transducer TonB [Candidatus Velthaea sp.]|jgi:TonB family protein
MYNVLPFFFFAAILPNSPVAPTAAHPSCTVDHQAAHIVRSETPEYPALARIEGLTGTATVRVDLSQDGTVTGASIVKSAGSATLNRAALQTAKSMVYAAETRSCQPVSGSYAVEVEYADP